jgi:hypothetical protein
MSDDKPHDAYYTSPVIEFDPLPALLGADTNGAAPQRVHGMFVSANLCESDGKPSGGYWIKVNTAKPTRDDPDHHNAFEHVAFVETPHEVESILGAIVNASRSTNFEQTLKNKVGGWHNSGQVNFNEDTQEDCVYNLTAKVAGAKHGFSLRLFDNTKCAAPNVATIYAKVTPEGIDTALKIVRDLHDWSSEHTRIIEKEIEAKTAPAAAPGL